MNQPTLTGFDWNALDPDTRFIVHQTTERLHELERRTGEAIIQIGNGLIDTKERIGHGRFLDWISSEFSWSEPTAQRFMRVAEVFENRQIDGFQPSALYALASGNVPEPIREEFIAKAEAGAPVRHKDVKARLDQERRLSTVDRDTGELIDDDPEIEHEEVDPNDLSSYVFERPSGHVTRPTPMPVSEHVRSFGEDGITEITPSRVANKLNDVESLLARARIAWHDFPQDVIAAHADTPETRDRLDTIISISEILLNESTSMRNQLSAGERLRAVK